MKIYAVGVFVLLAALGWPQLVEACSCGGRLSSVGAVSSSETTFLGTVVRVDGPRSQRATHADGSVRVGMTDGPIVTTFAVHRAFRGRQARELTLVRDFGGSCDVVFTPGESWLVYANTLNGQLRADTCGRTRLRSAASQDLLYIDGLQQGRPQGVLSGQVNRQTRDEDGRPVLRALFEPLQVVAVGGGRRIEVTTDRWGPYQVVLPPGEFMVWVERHGRRVSRREAVKVAHGSDLNLSLAADYED